MKRLGLRFARKKPVRSSTQGSLTVSAAAPNSGFAFIDNSEGASAALNELSTAISEALDLIDLDGMLFLGLRSRIIDREQMRWTMDNLHYNCSGSRLRQERF
jgi:hypothetical protein